MHLQTDRAMLHIRNNGTIDHWCYDYKGINKKVQFNDQKLGFGPCWHGTWDKVDHKIQLAYNQATNSYEAERKGLKYSITYHLEDSYLDIICGLTNLNTVPFQPDICGIKLGVDTDMVSYPEWLDKFFPTYLRCEKTHFTGYLMSPTQDIISISSADPIASWSLDYNKRTHGGYEWGGHRIKTLNLDLLHKGPLPKRHNHDLYELLPGESKEWQIRLEAVHDISQLSKVFFKHTEAPIFELEQTSLALGSNMNIPILSGSTTYVKIISSNGTKDYLVVEPDDHNICQIQVLGKEEGTYTIIAENALGMISEAKINVLRPFSWYMEKSADAALKHMPRATTHCESYYGFYSLYEFMKIDQKQKYFETTEELMNIIYPQIFDEGQPMVHSKRIQNTAAMINLLAIRYEVTKDKVHLHQAYTLATWLMTNAQAEDGSYRGGKTHYTSVIYPAKNMMALMREIRPLTDDAYWQDAYNELYSSVKRAIDELVASNGDIDTEGELTFEDGMISCSATQIAQFALLQTDEKQRKHYLESALRYINQHACLTNLYIPDCRMRGGTLRFWEAQYDIGMQYNFLNSPHGWSSWRTYATYYLYLLTGNPEYLIQTMNAISSAMQTIDIDSGKLHWAFVMDPHVTVNQITESCKPLDVHTFASGHSNTLYYEHQTFTIGEQYLDMVSHWQGANMQDNDVHEHFKCMAEIILTKAFIHEKEDGSLLCWNCHAIRKENGLLDVIPNEEVIRDICVYLQNPSQILVHNQESNATCGFTWISAK